MLERVLVALLAGGHVLLEGVPGLAKTLTVRTLAEALGGAFRRVQFTPDLVPADLVGTRIWRPDTGTFQTELGPVFGNLLLADEVNRAPAKVQSALLEVMQERQVTLGGETYPVPRPFLVLPPRTRSSPRAPTRCPRRRSTASCSRSWSTTRRWATRPRSSRASSPAIPRSARSWTSPSSSRRARSCARSTPTGASWPTPCSSPTPRATRPLRPPHLEPAIEVGASPARADRHRPGRPGARAPARPHPRDDPRHPRPGARRAAPPARPVLRRARRTASSADDIVLRRSSTRCRRPARIVGPRRCGGGPAAGVAPPPSPQGPGPMPAAASMRSTSRSSAHGGRAARRAPRPGRGDRHGARAAAALPDRRRRAPARPVGQRAHRRAARPPAGPRPRADDLARARPLPVDGVRHGARLKSDVAEGVVRVVSRLGVRRGGRVCLVHLRGRLRQRCPRGRPPGDRRRARALEEGVATDGPAQTATAWRGAGPAARHGRQPGSSSSSRTSATPRTGGGRCARSAPATASWRRRSSTRASKSSSTPGWSSWSTPRTAGRSRSTRGPRRCARRSRVPRPTAAVGCARRSGAPAPGTSRLDVPDWLLALGRGSR